MKIYFYLIIGSFLPNICLSQVTVAMKGKSLRSVQELIQSKDIQNIRIEEVTELDLRKNKISNMAGISTFTNLRVLRVGANPISYLPEEICLLSSLEYLDLWGTRIENLPICLLSLQYLKILDVRQTNVDWREAESFQQTRPDVKMLYTKGCNCR